MLGKRAKVVGEEDFIRDDVFWFESLAGRIGIDDFALLFIE